MKKNNTIMMTRGEEERGCSNKKRRKLKTITVIIEKRWKKDDSLSCCHAQQNWTITCYLILDLDILPRKWLGSVLVQVFSKASPWWNPNQVWMLCICYYYPMWCIRIKYGQQLPIYFIVVNLPAGPKWQFYKWLG